MAESPQNCGCIDPLTRAACTRSIDHLVARDGDHEMRGTGEPTDVWPMDYEADVEERREHFKRTGRPALAECFPDMVDLYDGC